MSATCKFIINNPYSEINWRTVKHIKANLHSHTLNSNEPIGEWSDNVVNTPKEMIERYEALGYEALAITDHDYVTYPWSDWGVSNSPMIAIQGNELSKNTHMSSYFTNYFDRRGEGRYITEGFEQNIINVGKLGGIMYVNHPARGGSTSEFDFTRELLNKFPHVVGIEVLNVGQFDKNNSETMWDQLLTSLMPKRNVWGTSTDDSHHVNAVGKGWTYLLLEEKTEAAAKDALINGKLIFSTSSGIPDMPVGMPPVISDIKVDGNAQTITVEAQNYATIEWISAEGRVVSTDKTIHLDTTSEVRQYVRARLFGPGGQTHTEPFGLIADI